MKKIVILGSGAGGTMCAAKLRRHLGRDWQITIIDNDEKHHYQPGCHQFQVDEDAGR